MIPGLGRVDAARLAVAVVVAAGFAVLWIEHGRDAGARAVRNRPIEVADDGYVSSSTCRSCHPHNYATWRASWHRTMTQVATPEAVVGDFDGVDVEALGHRYRLDRRGDAFFVELDDPDHRGPGRAPRVTRRILATTGSHHEQEYWYETGHTRELGFLPLMWRIEEARWIPFQAGFLRPPLEDLPAPADLNRWQTTCIKCHATHGKPRTRVPEGSRRMDTTVAEFGIGCEACHGPASDHVEANRNPVRRYGMHLSEAEDPTIVNPARLDADRASQVCGQCHGIHRPLQLMPRNARSADDWRDRGLAYRPGDDLAASRYLVSGRRIGEERFEEIAFFDPDVLADRFWPDGMVRVSGREYNGLIESPCFERGRGERRMSCLSCHEMHPDRGDTRPLAEWADDQLSPEMGTNRACVQCHAPFSSDAALAAHTRHAPDSTGSECMNCHMPYTTYGLLKAIRSHTISSPSVAETRDAGRPNACNLCHLDRTVAWTGAHLTDWYGAPAEPTPQVLTSVPLAMAWALGGDAGQRALSAWALGWEPAREASGADRGWVAPILAPLLADPYDAVRHLALASLRRQPGYENFEFDTVAPPDVRGEAVRRALGIFAERRRRGDATLDPARLIDDPSGALPARILERIHAQRNDGRVWLRE